MFKLQYMINLSVSFLNWQIQKCKLVSIFGDQTFCLDSKCWFRMLDTMKQCTKRNKFKIGILYFVPEINILLGLLTKVQLIDFIFESRFIPFGIDVFRYFVLRYDILDPIKLVWPYTPILHFNSVLFLSNFQFWPNVHLNFMAILAIYKSTIVCVC